MRRGFRLSLLVLMTLIGSEIVAFGQVGPLADRFKIVHLVPKEPAKSLSPYDAWAQKTIEQNDSSAVATAGSAASGSGVLGSGTTSSAGIVSMRALRP